MQYYVIIVIGKGLLSYNEEIYLYSIYFILFMIILNVINKNFKNVIIKESFNFIEFYEKLFFLKIKLLFKVFKFINIFKKKENNKYLLYKIFIILSKSIKNNTKKIILEYFKILLKLLLAAENAGKFYI